MKLFKLYKDETYTKTKLGRYLKFKHKLILILFNLRLISDRGRENTLELFSTNIQGNYIEMKPSDYIRLD